MFSWIEATKVRNGRRSEIRLRYRQRGAQILIMLKLFEISAVLKTCIIFDFLVWFDNTYCSFLVIKKEGNRLMQLFAGFPILKRPKSRLCTFSAKKLRKPGKWKREKENHELEKKKKQEVGSREYIWAQSLLIFVPLLFARSGFQWGFLWRSFLEAFNWLHFLFMFKLVGSRFRQHWVRMLLFRYVSPSNYICDKCFPTWQSFFHAFRNLLFLSPLSFFLAVKIRTFSPPRAPKNCNNFSSA